MEGIISRTKAGLEQEQPVRVHMDPEGHKQIEEYVLKIQELLDNDRTFTLIIEDPSGNSFVENPNAPAPDPSRKEKHFERTKKQDHLLGLYSQEELATSEDAVLKGTVHRYYMGSFHTNSSTACAPGPGSNFLRFC